MKYAVVETLDREDLVQDVNTYLELGWVPVGGVAITVLPKNGAGVYGGAGFPSHILYCQALSHADDNAEEPLSE